MAGVTPHFARLSDDELAELEHEIVKPCRVFEYFMDLNVFLGGKSKMLIKTLIVFFVRKNKINNFGNVNVLGSLLSVVGYASATPRLRL